MSREVVGSWEKFYRDVFGIEVELSKLKIPDEKEGFDRLIIVAQGMTPQKIFDKCKELFPCWKWTSTNLDEIVNSERASKDKPYAIWLRNRVEPDKDLKNFSANDLKELGIPGITLEERLLFELIYFKETGKHLDVESVTLCAGSRYSHGDVPTVAWFGGKVPTVAWFGGKMHVGGCKPGHRGAGLRSRRVVL